MIRKTILCAVLGFFALQLCYGQEIKNNLIQLKMVDNKLKIEKYISNSGAVEETNPKFDYAKLKIGFIGSLDDAKKIIVAVYARVNEGCDATGEVLNSIKALTTVEATDLSKFFGEQTVFNELPPRLYVIFRYENKPGNSAALCFDKVGTGNDAPKTDNTVKKNGAPCAQPSFYVSATFTNFAKITKKRSPYYLITQDFSDLDNSPQIMLFRPLDQPASNGSMMDKGEARTSLKVGRTATFVYTGYQNEYEKVNSNISFKDFNMEDRAIFQSYMGISKSAAASAAETTGGKTVNPTGTKPSELEAYKKVVEALITDLSSFRDDIYSLKVSKQEIGRGLLYVQENIMSCLSGLKDAGSASLETYLMAVSEDEGYRDRARIAISLLRSIEKETSTSTPSFQVKNADELQSEVSYFRKGSSSADFNRSFATPILWGWKLDFSSGFLFSKLSDEKYLITGADPVVDPATQEQTEMKKIVKEHQSDFKVGFGILAHFYPRMSKWFSAGVTSGFMVRDNLGVQFPIGISGMLGRESRLILSGGVIFGEMNVLSARYVEDTPVKGSTLLNVAEDKLVSPRTKRGWFFGLTYNFGGTNIGGATGK